MIIYGNYRKKMLRENVKLKKLVKELSGKDWQEVNRECVQTNISKKYWNFILCRQIVMLNRLLRKGKF